MSDLAPQRCALERELDLDLPSIRMLDADSAADFVDVLRTAVDRERRTARSDLDTKLAGRSRIVRSVFPSVVFGRSVR